MGIVLQGDTEDRFQVITSSNINEIHLVRNHGKHFSGRIKTTCMTSKNVYVL